MPRECPRCAADVPRRARFCPRCGAGVADVAAAAGPADDGGVLSARRKAIRELIVGWIFFVAGGVMIGAGIFFLGGLKMWLSIGFGVPIFFVGMGCLVGDSKKKPAGTFDVGDANVRERATADGTATRASTEDRS
ncbi:MAG TPA: zinc ribbon domain-containing protein [Humisphaera sp.]